MPSATINVQYVNPPKAGKKEGSVKTVEGVYYGVKPAMLSQFVPGGIYTVEYDTRMWNSKPFHTITTITSSQAPAADAAGATVPSVGKYGSTDNVTAERIFVCGALNAFITAGAIQPNGTQVKQAVLTLRAVWAETFGGKPVAAAPKASSAMDDEIPF